MSLGELFTPTTELQQDRDEEFRENHLGLLKRFYKVFESVYKYICDINR
jgi:WASH complex subunit strumpellin